nr:hypothetical protein [uncultured Dethiosulfovibrio sp.]
MKKFLLTLLLGLSLTLSLPFSGYSEPEKEEQPSQPQVEVPSQDDASPEKAVVPQDASITEHTVIVDGEPLTYEARAELMPLFDESGEEVARVFYVGYSQVDQDPVDRPITFAFNGGPGSSALFLHLGAFGPKSVRTTPSGIGLPRPPYVLEDNPQTLLDVTDMVFIDPVGTGYSRPSDVEDDRFFGVAEDIHWVAQFIRMYLTRENRWGSPVYLAGESYGGVRGTGLASALMDIGIMPSGIILVSPVANYGDLVPDSGNDRPFIHDLSAMAAAAWYHNRLPEDLQSLPLSEVVAKVRDWANGPYMAALWKGNLLGEEEVSQVVSQLARFTSLPERDIRSLNLRIPTSVFLSGLLQDRREMISRYDGRLTGPGGWYNYGEDPMFTVGGAPYQTAFMHYLINDLDFSSDREYFSSNSEVIYRWNFQSGSESFVGYPNTVDLLASAMRRSDFLKVFVAIGHYDLTCTYDSILYTLGRLDVPSKRLSENVTVKVYDGGHMMYSNPQAKGELKEDLAEFYRREP